MTDWKREHDAELGLRREFSARASAAEAEVKRLRAAIRTVVETFEKDQREGFQSRDRTFAIEILRPALTSAKQSGEA